MSSFFSTPTPPPPPVYTPPPPPPDQTDAHKRVQDYESYFHRYFMTYDPANYKINTPSAPLVNKQPPNA